MTLTLKNHQQELERKAVDLEELNAQLSDQIQYSQTILQKINAGILSTDEADRVRACNPAALKILGLTALTEAIPLADLFGSGIHQPLLRQWREHCQRGFVPLFRQLELIDEEKRHSLYIAANMVPLLKDDKRTGSLVVLEDLTALLNAQKVAAWREVAKRVAHEIKNPLTPIQLSIQRVRRKSDQQAADLTDAIRSAYTTIMSETDLLKNLVNEFSTFAKLPGPVKKRTDLAALVASVVETYEPVYPDHHLDFAVAAGDYQIPCDASQIRQVLSNLIDNAAQASPAGETVTVGLVRAANHVVLRITDTGKGIAEDDRAKVFLPYYSKSPKGTGLGLAIVKRIVEDHGGEIDVAENQPRGTIFQITLPLA